jgi:hypothetical protein
MQVGRDKDGEHALMVLTVDRSIDTKTSDELSATIGAHRGRKIDLID